MHTEIIFQSEVVSISVLPTKFYSILYALPFSDQLLLIKYWWTKSDVNKRFQMHLHTLLDVFFHRIFQFF